MNGHVLYPELGKLAGAPVGIANNCMLPPPGWFWIPTLLVFFPAALFGARLAPRRDPATT